jgi:hypothetical protein
MDRMEIECSGALGSTAVSLPAAADTRQHRAEEGKKPEAQQKIGSSKALALLTTLFERMERNADPANTQAPAYSAALNAVVGQVKTNTTQSKVSSWLVDEMSRLDRLLVQSDKMSISINCCYWSIGLSYREFCKVRLASCRMHQWRRNSLQSSHITRGHSQHPRTLEKEAFARLCATPSISDVLSSAAARSRLRKRLQRARKLVTLVDIFGEQVLQWVPEISVSRLDVVRQEDLQMIAAGSIEQRRVLAIKAGLPEPLVDEVADLAVALKNSH